MGITENFWEHRSFAEQGLERIPQIHLGEKASALEREGIHTVRGDINRDIIAHNLAIDMARMAYEKALKELEKAKELAVMVAENIKNEILDAFKKVAERNHNRLKLPIVKGKYIGSVSDRASLQNRSKMESYVHGKGWTTFEEMNAEKKSLESRYKQFEKDMNKIGDRMEYLEKLLKLYKKLEPYKKINDEYFKLKNGESKKGTFFGFGKSLAEKYKMEHQTELNTYKMMKNALTGMIDEQDKRIKPVAWKKEYEDLEMKYEKCEDSIYDIVPDLAKMEVLDYNKRDLDRMLINESHKRGRDIINERLASAKEKANEYNVQIFDSVTEHSGINHSREDR